MLDAVKENVESCPRYVEGFHMKVQEFNFVEHRYDCILGVWTLCYLNFADRKEVFERYTDPFVHKATSYFSNQFSDLTNHRKKDYTPGKSNRW